MATTRPEASETTGTLRETSGVTAPVTTNSETVGCAVAAASGNCSGWSTVKRLRSTSGTTLAGGGRCRRRIDRPVAAAKHRQYEQADEKKTIVKNSIVHKDSLSATTNMLRQTNAMFPKLAGRVPTLWRGSLRNRLR